MSQISIVILIILIAGLLGGGAGYLLDPISSGDAAAPLKKHGFFRYLLLGVIAAACVPLFLSVLQSDLMTNIFKVAAEGSTTPVGVPFVEFLILTGFCLIASVFSRRFLDTVSQQVMRSAAEAQAAAVKATKTAEIAEAKATDAEAIAKDIMTEVAESNAPAVDAATLNAEMAAVPDDVTVPPLSPDEKQALAVMTSTTYRTATGVAGEIGRSRTEAASLLRSLASKGLVEPTTSTKTGGVRWRITPLGIRALG
jgi:hypothetical protein